MANVPLTGNTISSSYQGLLKAGDSGAIGATEKIITDGLANASTLSLGTSSASFTGTLDLSGATVTGLPAAAAGLVSGTGTDSMKNADSLVTTPAVAAAACSIALGDTALVNPNATGGIAIGYDACIQGASSIRTGQIAIGCNTRVVYDGIAIGGDAEVIGTKFSLAIGCGASDASGTCNVSIGYLAGVGAPTVKTNAIMIGTSAKADSNAVALGANSCANSTDGIAIGTSSSTRLGHSIAVGTSSCSYGTCDIAVGFASDACGGSSIAIGNTAQVALDKYHGIAIGCGTSVTGEFAGAIGSTSSATANGAYALGQGVTAATADTVSVKALETQTASTPTAGGIIMTDAGSTARRLNIDASGNLKIDSTPVGGGGGAAGLESGTGTDSMQSAASLTTVAADAAASCSIAIGSGALTSGTLGGNIAIGDNAQSVGSTNNAGIAIGKNSCVGGYDGTVVGVNATTPTNGQVFGINSCVSGNQGVALGFITFASGGSTALGHLAKACGIASTAVHQACALSTYSIAIGENACVGSAGTCGIAIGCGATVTNTNTVAIGVQACSTQDKGIAIGCSARAFASGGSVAIGFGVVCAVGADRGLGIGEDYIISGGDGISIGTTTRASACCAVAIGRDAQATACSAIALGAVTASRVNTVTGCQLEACVAGKGIVVTSPDGLTTLGIGIDNSGNIVTYTP